MDLSPANKLKWKLVDFLAEKIPAGNEGSGKYGQIGHILSWVLVKDIHAWLELTDYVIDKWISILWSLNLFSNLHMCYSKLKRPILQFFVIGLCVIS